jgi:acyl-coenzyme A synthetase/AMP-(fatty) acid ligase
VIAALLRSRAEQRRGALLLHGARGPLGYAPCLHEVERLVAEHRAWSGARLGLAGAHADWLLPHLFALDELGARACLLPPEARAAERDALCSELGLAAVLEPEQPAPAVRATPALRSGGEVVLFSSGTTGPPRPAIHTWESLASRVRARPSLAGRRWLLGYGLTSFAGLQVFLHALANGGSLVVGGAGPAEAARLAREQGVTHASGTPTFFRLLLAQGEPADLAALKLVQITLGGEATDQGLLDSLRRRFPDARLTQIYASTELGVCFSVHDGRAGFPAAYLEGSERDARLRIVDGELHVAAPPAASGYLEADRVRRADAPLFATGDLVERRGDRVVFLGRRGQSINVGGRKAFPTEIEAAVLEVAGVRAVRVSGLPSSLVGELVRAEVVLEPGVEPEAARRALLAHCRERLTPHMVPRRLEFVRSLEHTPSRKIARR